MEELQSSSHFSNEDDDDEFYEKIEAPKFVDFTVPDPSRPDDRSWFCLRVGCEQKHEEEMDPDALHRSFVLRVMAARSPNVRLRKALSRQALSTNMKCPLSAPAKSSKPRISKLTEITLVSQKMADSKVKVHPLPKLKFTTPTAKAKQSSVVTKALTTPRNKRCLQNPDPFRSGRNSKTTVAVPKTRVIAKALVFHTPKKTERRKIMSKYRTPVTEICAGMKKLEISSQRKEEKSSRDVRCKAKKSLPLDPSRRKLGHRKIKKTGIEVPFLSRDCQGQEAKTSKCLKGKSKENLQKFHGSVPQERVDNDSSNMEVDGKSRDGSLEVCSVSGSSRNNEGSEPEMCLGSEKNPEKLGLTKEFEEKDPLKFQTSNGEGDESTESSGHEENNGSNSKEERNISEKDDLPSRQTTKDAGNVSESEAMDSDDKENNGSNSKEERNISEKDDLPSRQTTKGVGNESELEAMDSDDKENALASDDNRDLNLNMDQSVRKILNGTREPQEVTQAGCKATFKESSAFAATGAQGAKYRKLKPTNPKPFRLRTDERGILKEANLERRQHLDATVKEAVAIPRTAKGNSQKRHGNENHLNEKQHGQCRQENDGQEGNRSELDKRTQKVETVRMMKNAMTRFDSTQQMPKLVTKQLKDDKDIAAPNIASSSKKVKSSLLRQPLVRPRNIASARKATTSKPPKEVVHQHPETLVSPSGRLGILREKFATTCKKPKEASKQPETCSNNAASASKSSSRGRKPTTITKEPYFHSIHICQRHALRNKL